jgi:hypothetical protein
MAKQKKGTPRKGKGAHHSAAGQEGRAGEPATGGSIVEFFTASCLCQGRVSIDGVYQGESRDAGGLRVFQCAAGLHDVTMEYQNGGPGQKQTRRVMITGTTPILPMAIPFICEI